jgi:hypothetical protein
MEYASRPVDGFHRNLWMVVMTQFNEGQEVVVQTQPTASEKARWFDGAVWRKARISYRLQELYGNGAHEVQFPDGTRAVFDAEHIRAVGIYERWLSDNNFNDCAESQAAWNAMVEANEQFVGLEND